MSCSKTQWKKGDVRLIGNSFAKGHKPNRTTFKKGLIPWNKGLTKNDSPKIMNYSIRMKINNPIYKINQKKENNFNWKGGLSYEKYSLAWTKFYRNRVRNRDKYICQLCNKEVQKRLAVHHIDYNKQNCNHLNLISLCVRCHPKTNSNRGYWKVYFLLLMNKKRELFRSLYETT